MHIDILEQCLKKSESGRQLVQLYANQFQKMKKGLAYIGNFVYSNSRP